MKKMKKMDNDELLKLYELFVDEEHYFLSKHQRSIAWYSGIVSALVAAIAAGLFQASELYHFAFLCAGPVLLYLVSTNAVQGISRPYQRFLETITVRAKIEQELGLTHHYPSEADTAQFYWKSEPIIALRHIESRKNYETSSTFVEEHLTKGYHRTVMRLFRLLRWLSVLMLVAILLLTIGRAGLL